MQNTGKYNFFLGLWTENTTTKGQAQFGVVVFGFWWGFFCFLKKNLLQAVYREIYFVFHITSSKGLNTWTICWLSSENKNKTLHF